MKIIYLLILLFFCSFIKLENRFLWEENFIYRTPNIINEFRATKDKYNTPWYIVFGATKLKNDSSLFVFCNCVYGDSEYKQRLEQFSKKQYLDFINLQGLLCELKARQTKRDNNNKLIFKSFRDFSRNVHDSLKISSFKYEPTYKLFSKMNYLTDSLNKELFKLQQYSNQNVLGIFMNFQPPKE